MIINAKLTRRVLIEKISEDKEYIDAEDFFVSCLDGCSIKKSGSFIFYVKGNNILFQQNTSREKKSYFWVHYRKIWMILTSKFDLDYDEQNKLILSLLNKNINFEQNSPTETLSSLNGDWIRDKYIIRSEKK